ncbi:MAG: hypothetical protein EA387_08790 [Nitriliruptor sp.]|nr:MAG: hypothetical protein EA387_08790 [Nitriliruptor sp.]
MEQAGRDPRPSVPWDGDVVPTRSVEVEQLVELPSGLVRRPGLPPVATGGKQGRGQVLLPRRLVGTEVDHAAWQRCPPAGRDPTVDRAWRDPDRLQLASGAPPVLGAGERGCLGIDHRAGGVTVPQGLRRAEADDSGLLRNVAVGRGRLWRPVRRPIGPLAGRLGPGVRRCPRRRDIGWVCHGGSGAGGGVGAAPGRSWAVDNRAVGQLGCGGVRAAGPAGGRRPSRVTDGVPFRPGVAGCVPRRCEVVTAGQDAGQRWPVK